jgi:hypothetical protein
MSRADRDREQLSEIIDRLVEEMGKINPRAFHGYGAVQPYYVKSTREMLGYVEHEMEKEKEGLENPVKVSRAFTGRDEEDEEFSV